MEIFFGKEVTSISGKKKEQVIEDDFTMTYISNYIIEILIHFTEFREDGTLNLRKYLDTVFIHIVDVWGFITAYYPILDFLNDNYDDLSDEQLEMFDLIKELFLNYLYSPRIEPIDHYEIVSELRKLSDLLKNEISETASGISKQKLKYKHKHSGVTGKTFIPKTAKLNLKRSKKNKKVKGKNKKYNKSKKIKTNKNKQKI